MSSRLCPYSLRADCALTLDLNSTNRQLLTLTRLSTSIARAQRHRENTTVQRCGFCSTWFLSYSSRFINCVATDIRCNCSDMRATVYTTFNTCVSVSNNAKTKCYSACCLIRLYHLALAAFSTRHGSVLRQSVHSFYCTLLF